MPMYYTTQCCALFQIRCGNIDSKEQIINSMIICTKDRYDLYGRQLYTSRSREKKITFYIITTPTEKELVQKVEDMGFENTSTFPRIGTRGNCKMWIKTFTIKELLDLYEKNTGVRFT